MKTVAEQLALTGGRPSGFDYMRLILAVLVIVLHAGIVCYSFPGEIALWESPARALFRLILPMFFVLSGFLVAGSLERSRTVGLFLGLRAIRIYPALAVESLLSALVIGPIFTSLALSAYFSHPLFHLYFLNLLGEPQYVLPGVFQGNPLPDWVNRQLWTVPFELLCYAMLAAAALVGARKHRILLPLAALGVALLYGAAKFVAYHGAMPHVIGPMPGILLVSCFLFGVAGYYYRDRIRFSFAWFAVALLAACLLVAVVPQGDYLAPIPVAYITIYLGLLDPRRIRIIRGADYSYGIFLYGFPIQQAVAAFGPWGQNPAVNSLASVAIAAMFAAASWHLIEKPALNLRRPLTRLEERWLGWRASRKPALATANAAD